MKISLRCCVKAALLGYSYIYAFISDSQIGVLSAIQQNRKGGHM